jgi:predicted small secreted protein
MNKKTLLILATALLAALTGGCATTQEAGQIAQAPEQRAADKPVMRPFGGVGSYGGYIYRRYE